MPTSWPSRVAPSTFLLMAFFAGGCGADVPADGGGMADAGPAMSVIPDPELPAGGTITSTDLALPDGLRTAPEHRWTVRLIDYHPDERVPRRMYFDSCATDSASPSFYASVTLEDADGTTSGSIVLARLDDATQQLVPSGVERRLEECSETQGIAVSDDCLTVAVLCRRENRAAESSPFTRNSLLAHPDADWMTQPSAVSADGIEHVMEEVWLYEWTTGDLSAEPDRYVVHSRVRELGKRQQLPDARGRRHVRDRSQDDGVRPGRSPP